MKSIFDQNPNLKLKNAADLEKAEAELIEVRILKQDLLKLFKDYKDSRRGFFHQVFRNLQLSLEKIKIANQAIELIQNFKGNKNELIEALKIMRVQNADVSSSVGKFHFNLLELNEDPCDIFSRVGAKGHSFRRSDLALVFHKAIQKLLDSDVPEFKLNLS